MCLRLGPPSAKIQWSVKVVIMKDGANDELQGLSFRDNDCKPRFSEIGGGDVNWGVHKRGAVSHNTIYAARNSLSYLHYLIVFDHQVLRSSAGYLKDRCQ